MRAFNLVNPEHLRTKQVIALLIAIVLLAPLANAKPLHAHVGSAHNFAQEVELSNREYIAEALGDVSDRRSTLAQPTTAAARKQACQSVSERLTATTRFISSQTTDEVSRLDRILDASLAYLNTRSTAELKKAATAIQDKQHTAQLSSISLSALQRKIDCNYADPAQIVAAYRLNLADAEKAVSAYRSALILFIDTLIESEV